MKEKDYKKELVKVAESEVLKDQYMQNVGQKAVVERHDATGESIDQLRACLAELGDELGKRGIAPKGMQYVGSLSTHVFHSEILKVTAFVNLNNMKALSFGQADAACREMNNKVKEYWGQRRQKLRSGF